MKKTVTITKTPILGEPDAVCTIHGYCDMPYRLACKLLEEYVGATRFFVKLKIINGLNKFFDVETDKGVFSIMLSHNTININFYDKTLCFRVSGTYPEYVLEQKKCMLLFPEEDKSITEEFIGKKLFIKLSIFDKLFEMIVQVNEEEFLDIAIFDQINLDSDINTLKRIYFEHIFNMQTEDDQKADAFFAISRYTDRSESETIESMIINSGFVENFTISSESNGTTISLKTRKNHDDEIIIKNFNPTSLIDLNREIAQLYKRAKNITFSGFVTRKRLL